MRLCAFSNKGDFVNRFLSLFMVGFCLLLTGCGSKPSHIQSFRYYENAKQKPVAILVPLIVRDQNAKISWSISNEITSEVQRRLIQRGEIFLNQAQLSDRLKDKLHSQDFVTLSSEDLSELKAQNEYAVFMELIEHQEYTAEQMMSKKEEDVEYLSLKVRLRVFDLREKEPKVLLQEILHYKPYIPFVERDTDYSKVVWGGDSYPASLYGRTHSKLEKDLTHQIETYISISK